MSYPNQSYKNINDSYNEKKWRDIYMSIRHDIITGESKDASLKKHEYINFKDNKEEFYNFKNWMEYHMSGEHLKYAKKNISKL